MRTGGGADERRGLVDGSERATPQQKVASKARCGAGRAHGGARGAGRGTVRRLSRRGVSRWAPGEERPGARRTFWDAGGRVLPVQWLDVVQDSKFYALTSAYDSCKLCHKKAVF